MASSFHAGDEDEKFASFFEPSPPPPISPMASRFRAREVDERFPPFLGPSPPPHPASTDRYFSHQAIRAGYMGSDGPMMRPRMSLEALERELMEEKIREEIIARRIAQRRMLEEQTWREMEMAMTFGGRRELDYGRESGDRRRFVSRPERRDLTKVMIGRSSASFREVEIADEAPGDEFRKRDVGFEEREKLPVRDVSELGAGKKLAYGPEKTVIKMDEKAIPQKLSAIKRKTPAAILGNSASKFPRPAHKEWSCALCQVSATSEEALNEHLQGRKHLNKAAQLAPKKNLAATPLANTNGSCSSSSFPKQGRATKKKPVAKGMRKVSIQVDGKLHEVTEEGHFLWCWMCKVKCNGLSAMICHLSGRKHLLEESRNLDAAAEGTVENEEAVLTMDKGTLQNGVVNREVTLQNEEVVEAMEKYVTSQNSESKDIPGSEVK